MKLEDYITEAISGRNNTSRRFTVGNEITEKTTFDDACQILEYHGISRIPNSGISTDTLIDRDITLKVLRNWNLQYDAADLSIGVSAIVAVTNRKFYVLYWDTRHKDSGPIEGLAVTGNHSNGKLPWYARSSDEELRNALDELNKDLSTMI
jgi:hypothetical protein